MILYFSCVWRCLQYPQTDRGLCNYMLKPRLTKCHLAYSILSRIVASATIKSLVVSSHPMPYSILKRIVLSVTRTCGASWPSHTYSILKRIVAFATWQPASETCGLTVSSNGSWPLQLQHHGFLGYRPYSYSILKRIVASATLAVLLAVGCYSILTVSSNGSFSVLHVPSCYTRFWRSGQAFSNIDFVSRHYVGIFGYTFTN